MGLGCGNPQAITALRVGETVLNLGRGGGQLHGRDLETGWMPVEDSSPLDPLRDPRRKCLGVVWERIVTYATQMPIAGSSPGSEYIAPLSSRERLISAEWERARVKLWS